MEIFLNYPSARGLFFTLILQTIKRMAEVIAIIGNAATVRVTVLKAASAKFGIVATHALTSATAETVRITVHINAPVDIARILFAVIIPRF